MSPGPGKTSQRPGPGAPDPSVPKFFEEPRCPPCEGGKGRSGGRSPRSPSIQGCGGPRPGVGRSLVLPPPGVFRNCPPRPNGYGYGDSPGTPSPRSPEARCADLTPPREAARRTPSTVRPSRRSPGGCALGGGGAAMWPPGEASVVQPLDNGGLLGSAGPSLPGRPPERVGHIVGESEAGLLQRKLPAGRRGRWAQSCFTDRSGDPREAGA